MKLRHSLAIALCLVGVEAVGLTLAWNNQAMGWGVALFSLIVNGFLLLALASWRASRAVYLRRQWLLLSVCFVLYLVALTLRFGIYLATLEKLQVIPQQIDYTDLLMVLGYIPLFIFLSLPSGKLYPRAFFWIDSVQALVAGYLLYVWLFSIHPFTHTADPPISGDRLIAFDNLINLVLCMAAVFRYMASTGEDEKNFYRAYGWFTAVTLVLYGVYNAAFGQSEHADYGQLLGTLPGLFFCVFITRLPTEHAGGVSRSPNLFTAFLNTASPFLFTASLLVLGINAARTYFGFGIGAVVAAFVLYGLRATLLQRSYEQSQLALQEARDHLQRLSLTDELTGIANRRCFDQTLLKEWGRSSRMHQPLSLMMIDIDHFKQLNDKYGHQVGDACLRMIALALRDSLTRGSDFVARYGGEEFAVIVPNADGAGALRAAVLMQQAVHDLAINNESLLGPKLSVSIGLATSSLLNATTSVQLLKAADDALYRAKSNGRNRLEVANVWPDSDGTDKLVTSLGGEEGQTGL